MLNKVISLFVVAIVLIFLTSLYAVFDRANHLAYKKDDLSLRVSQSYFIDYQATLELEELMEKPELFQQVHFNRAPTEFGKQNFWYKVELTNLTYKEKKLSLFLDNPTLDFIDVYEIKNNTLIGSKELGDKRLGNNIEEFAFPSYMINLPALESSTIYIKSNTEGPSSLPMALFENDKFERYKFITYLTWGIFVGVSLLIAVYNLILYVGVRDKAYLLYIGYVVVFLLLLAGLHGFLIYITPIALFDDLTTKVITLHFLIGFLTLMFAYYFLQYDKEPNHKLSKFCRFVSYLFLAGGVSSLFIPEYIAATIFFSTQPLLYLVAGSFIFHRIKQRTRWANYYFVSWLPLLVGSVISPLVLTGNLEYSFLSRHSLLFGVLFEMTFISMGLAERLRRIEFEKEYSLNHDPLFGLPNLNSLEQTYGQLTKVRKPKFSFLVVVIDNYDSIVPYLKKSVLKKLVEKFANDLQSVMSTSLMLSDIDPGSNLSKVTLIRDGVFGLVVLSTDKHLVESVVKQYAINQPINYQDDNLSVNLNCFVGGAIYSSKLTHSQELINRSLQAIESASSQGMHYGFYDEQTHGESERKVQLASDMTLGLNKQQFFLVYQPQIDIESREVVGCEVLLRWEHPVYGFVPPSDFVKIAEDAGTVNKLTEWVFEQSCKENKLLSADGIDLTISINISVHDLMTKGFSSFLIRTLNKYELRASSFLLELTETVGVDDSLKFTEALLELKDLGFNLAIDDFGTGYSSLTYVSKHPFDVLKIDREFIMFLPQSEKDQTIVDATITMARSLNLKVVAEGIEDETTINMLQKLGCDKAQGFHIAKPMKLQSFMEWVTEEKTQLNKDIV